MHLVHKIVERISAIRTRDTHHITVVGIDGPTAAGKTMLADAITTSLRGSGLAVWTFQLDWALKGRAEREADVAHLRTIEAAFEFEGELHMRLDLARRFLASVAHFNQRVALGEEGAQALALRDLYSRAHGGTVTGSETMTLVPGMVILIEGHYTLRNELDALIDLNVVLLSEPEELLSRKVNRVKGYRSPDDAIHYFRNTDLPSFNHHLARFGANADFVVDNTDYLNPRIIRGEDISGWLARSGRELHGKSRQLRSISDINAFVFSDSTLVPADLSQMLTAAIQAVRTWDQMVGHYLRVAVNEVDEDLETLALRATADINRTFESSAYRCRLSHTDALYYVYHRQLPLTLGLEIYTKATGATAMTLLAEVDRAHLGIGIFWDGGMKWLRLERSLGEIDGAAVSLSDGTPVDLGVRGHVRVFLPTEFALPSFLEGTEIEPVFIGREQENISASKILSAVLHQGGVWIHRFALHREIHFFQYCLGVVGVPSLHVGNYLIAVKTSDTALRHRFREFCREWQTPIARRAVMEAGYAAYDQVMDRDKAESQAYFRAHCRHLTIQDGVIFGDLYVPETADEILVEIGALLRSPHRILRKRAVEFLNGLFPGLTLPTTDLWDDVPDGARTTLSLNEFTGLSSSIMAEVYLWLALRNQKSAILGANVYDIRPSSLDARAFLDAAAEHGCPIVLQCSFNAVGQQETHGDVSAHGYLKPMNGVEDFSIAARRAARDLYLQAGKRPPLFGIGLDHVNVMNDQPAFRAKRFLQHALTVGGVTHIVLDGSDLFQVKSPTRVELTATYERMNAWVLDLMDTPQDTLMKDMEVCISELNYLGKGSDAYVPSTGDIELFASSYTDALVASGYASHVARPKLFISNLGTCHHSNDEVVPWVERSREWRDAVKRDGFVSAVLHGTSRSHQETLAAATVGCHKVNVAGDFLDTIVTNLPMRLSRTIQESDGAAKYMIPVIRPDMERMSNAESQTLYQALKEHCARVLKTIASPQLSSMDINYFQHKDFAFTEPQISVVVSQIERELQRLIPKIPSRLADTRQGCAFAASMIEVPLEEFRGPILDGLWDAGIRHFHVDEGDGVFIPRRFSGVEKTRYLREHFPTAAIHAHLMVVDPHFPKDGEFSEIQQYAEAGADAIAIHMRSCRSLKEGISALKIIRKLNLRAGIVVETSDSVDEDLEALIRDQGLDWVVVMGVPIGYGGQLFQNSTLNRISRLHDLAGRLGRDFLVECDGGLTMQNVELCRKAGGQLFAGWSIIKGPTTADIQGKVRMLRGILAPVA